MPAIYMKDPHETAYFNFPLPVFIERQTFFIYSDIKTKYLSLCKECVCVCWNSVYLYSCYCFPPCSGDIILGEWEQKVYPPSLLLFLMFKLSSLRLIGWQQWWPRRHVQQHERNRAVSRTETQRGSDDELKKLNKYQNTSLFCRQKEDRSNLCQNQNTR